MELSDQTIGVWGLGLVGQAAVRFLHAQGIHIQVMDRKKPSQKLAQLLIESKAEFVIQNEKNKNLFLETHELIFPSPGIDLKPYKKYEHKWLSEVDLFGLFFKKPIIAITGTIGKTSITTLLAEMIRASGKKVLTGGNIGIPLLDLIEQQNDADYAVIELSSFQLSITRSFAPDLAIWTNFFPNHLDWHGTIGDYLNAKLQILRYQTATNIALVPLQSHTIFSHKKIASTINYFSLQKYNPATVLSTPIYNFENNEIVYHLNNTQKKLGPVSALPKISYVQNWLIIYAALDILNLQVKREPTFILPKTNPLEHRLEYVATINNVDFYNDSKATVAQATLAAIESLGHRSIILLLGGLSKGVNRKKLIDKLPSNIKLVVCFGKESYQLHKLCVHSLRSACSVATLEQAYAYAVKRAQAGDVVLLSPGGTSFDLFANYQERGRCFKDLVMKQQSI